MMCAYDATAGESGHYIFFERGGSGRGRGARCKKLNEGCDCVMLMVWFQLGFMRCEMLEMDRTPRKY